MLDSVVLARKTGAGAIRRPVLVALGLRPDGKKEVIDFRLAHRESAAEWERFLGDLIRRGLTGDSLEMICVDGGSGLLASLPTAFPAVPVQRCWAHKIAQCAGQGAPGRPVRRADQCAVKADLQARPQRQNPAPGALRRPPLRRSHWEADYPKAVACLRGDLDELLTCWRYKSLNANGSEPPTPSNGVFAKSDGEPGRWASFRPHLDGPHPVRRLHPRKPKTRASAPLTC